MVPGVDTGGGGFQGSSAASGEQTTATGDKIINFGAKQQSGSGLTENLILGAIILGVVFFMTKKG